MLSQTMSQKQDLRLTARLVAAISLMEIPVLDLQEKITEELERNPALEAKDQAPDLSFDAVSPQQEEDTYFETSSDPGFPFADGEDAANRRLQFIEGALTRSESLQDHLLWQLQLEPLDKDTRSLCETLIQNLDENGFNLIPVDELFSHIQDKAHIEKAMRIVQSLDPVGTCVKDYEESLRVQIRLLPDMPDGAEAALDCLDLLRKDKFAEAAKKLGRSEDEVRAFFARIKELTPFPGRLFSSKETRFVIPDVRVIKREGEFFIILNDEAIPVLGINPFFEKIAGENTNKEARNFAKENIREARWFINAVQERNRTLLKVSQAIVASQKTFFEKGPGNLVPLTQQIIADELEIHESTVSRIASGKYMQTEWGIFGIKYFFTNSISPYGAAGVQSQFSKESVKAKIKAIIADDAGARFSDRNIVDKLAEQGICIARRTVAKYRKELDVGSSYDR